MLANTRELKQDVLFRASEQESASDWDTKVIEYLNRVYRTLCTGASEFLPEYVEDWWWLRDEAVLLLEPAYVTGTVAVTQGSTSITFSDAPAASMLGRRLKVTDQADIPLIAAHTGGATTATLDQVWTGDTLTAAEFRCMKTDYTLAAAVQALMSPIVVFQRPERITGMSPEHMDIDWPLAYLDVGIPQAFALQSESEVRFSHGGSDQGFQHRLEYRYRRFVDDLTDSVDSIPLVPPQWRHLLADMALTYVLIDKNDDRSNAVALGARTGLAAMIKDNRRRNVKIDANVGKIMTRPTLRRSIHNHWGR